MLLNKNVRQVKEVNKELQILQSAEDEFLKKGYTNAKTTEIAKRAGVTHAMLHYYFRTKENLFETIFQQKIGLLTDTFLFSFSQDLPFLEKIKKGVEDHFDFIAANPKLAGFILGDIMKNEDRKQHFIDIIKPKAGEIKDNIELSMQDEVARGAIKYVDPLELIFTVVSLNIFPFLASPLVIGILNLDDDQIQSFFQQRKDTNVNLVLNMFKK